MPQLSKFLLFSPSLTNLAIEAVSEPSNAWVQEVLPMCAFACAATRSQGALKVHLPRMGPATLQGAKQLWEQLMGRMAAPASVVVTHCEGTDLQKLFGC